MQRAVIAMKKTFAFAVAAALGLGGAIGAFALLVGKPADHGGSASSASRPVWTEEVSQAVNSTLDRETVLHTIVAKATQLSGTEAGAIYELGEASGEFQLRATYGMDDDLITAIKDHHADISESVARSTQQRARHAAVNRPSVAFGA